MSVYRSVGVWTLDLGRDNNVLLSQSYFTPHGAVIDEYRAMAEWYIDRGKPKNSEKICPIATLSTTNPTWTDLGANMSLCGERPATNRLSHDTALWSRNQA
jgi:hypothetical protein